MAVHAHPDDEASSTGGLLARSHAEGVRTVLVTCTNGELGDGPGGVKPGDPGHVEEEVVAERMVELRRSCEILGISDLELLGYHDSGMEGWKENEAPSAFANVDLSESAGRLAELMRQYRPQVVVTYDEYGFYGHPDHIQANRITRAAIEMTDIPEKFYYPAIPRSRLKEFAEQLRERGIEPPGPLEGDDNFGTPDELIGATIDCSGFTQAKFDSLAAHASQADNIFFLNMGTEFFAQVFGQEMFVRVFDRTGAPLPETDLFAGLR
jgi:LmbE family N-acetylglucosaminyl deacetylase